MTTDLTMLTATAVLTAALVMPYGLAMWTLWPVAEVLGNRDDPPALPPWAERARRAQRNMLENFPHFAALVLVAHVAGVANATTALGVTIFFWARLAHAIQLHQWHMAIAGDRVLRGSRRRGTDRLAPRLRVARLKAPAPAGSLTPRRPTRS